MNNAFANFSRFVPGLSESMQSAWDTSAALALDKNATIEYQSKGDPISGKGAIQYINFTGSGVTAIVDPVDTLTVDVEGGSGTGTVTSVGVSVPSIMSVSGSPVTGAGTIALDLTTQIANKILSGPATGANAIPTFRALVAADIPSLSYDASGAAAAAQAAAISTASADATTKANAAQAAAIAASQPLDSDLTAIAALATTAFGRSLLTQADAAATRATIGAGTSSFSGAFSALSGIPTTLSGYGITDAQPLDSDLTAIAALTTTAFGRGLLTLADAAAGRTAFGLGTLATQSGTFSGTSSGTNTGDQTTVSGNAGTATALQTARTINGVSFDGTANVIAALYGRVSGSNATRTAQTLADIAGLSVALAANSVYDFECGMSVASSSTAGNGYGVQFSAAGASVEAQINGTSTAAATITKRINALNTAASPFVAVAADGGILITGIFTTGANAGNLTIQHLKVTSGTATVYINSYLRAIKIA